ncbi:sensor histidine kinase [Clostridium hydrogenum]|uniref:sensor histidine kinase n=1 Tax=Clostridium hydrogenum TaxID=2855764 RepID=UPI001F31BDC9|nr:HAMP domain-containing sensor histidine kinase [Clostridium hydrogenum]
MKVGIKIKLTAFITSLLILVIVLLSFLVLRGIKNYQKMKNEDILLNQKNLFEQYLSNELNSSKYMDMKKQKELHLNNADLFDKSWLNSIPASIYDINGNLMYTIENDSKAIKNKDDNKMIKYCLENKIVYKEEKDNIYYYSPIKYNNIIVAVLKLRYSIKESNEFYNKIKMLFLMLGLISLGVGITFGALYLVPFTNDINKIIYSVGNIQNGDFNNMKKVTRNDELGILSSGVEFMSKTIENNIINLSKQRDDLTKAVEKLERLGKEQKEFIGNVTHEFKTPLTSIKASADIMLMYEYDPNFVHEASENTSKECDRLCDMIDDVLKLSSLEKYDFEIKKKPVNLKLLIEQISSRMMGKIKKCNIQFTTELEDLVITCDEEGIRHILINLIDNAIKYNKPDGSINICTYQNEKEVYIEVEDTGIGIGSSDFDKIFKTFYRIKNDRSRKTGGSGIGLAFVKKMVEKQNGRILVDSEVDVGSKFTVVLPMDVN